MVVDFIPYRNLFEIYMAKFKDEQVIFYRLGLISYKNNNNKKSNKLRKKPRLLYSVLRCVCI